MSLVNQHYYKFVVAGCAMSGLIADSRTMIDRARVEAQVDILTFLDSLTTHVALSFIAVNCS